MDFGEGTAGRETMHISQWCYQSLGAFVNVTGSVGHGQVRLRLVCKLLPLILISVEGRRSRKQGLGARL